MVRTKKLYRCKIFYETTRDGEEVVEVNNELSNMFIMDRLSLKCFCGGLKAGNKYYNIVYVYVDGRWIHPAKFVEYLFSEGVEL